MDCVEEFTIDEKSRIKKEFERLEETIYLDHAGASLYAESQLKDVFSVLSSNIFANPHTSKSTENIIDQIRYRILKFFNADPDDYTVIFTSGSTAAAKLVGECFQFTDNGAFFYLTDMHTSLLGLREIVSTNNIIPLSKSELAEGNLEASGKSLITFPAQCNFNGYKYSLNVIEPIHRNENNYVLLDAAAFAATNFLDLTEYKADYVCISFYKIFGYPTGLGALLVSKRGASNLLKKYYGGGTVKIALTRTNWHLKRDDLHEKFEDGTIDFLSIISLQSSFTFMEQILGKNFIDRISKHTYYLAKYFYDKLKALKHHNEKPVAVLYHDTNFLDFSKQGGIVNFNLIHPDGNFIGFAEFSCMAALHKVVLRTGCFCNPGSCQTHLKLTNEEIMKQFNAGHICGDENDLIDGVPTGSVRVSFGYMNTKEDVDKLLYVIEKCYANSSLDFAKRDITVKHDVEIPKLKSIRIFPIKSCGPMIITDSWDLNNKGLKYDREWMIINGRNGTSLTQKNEAKMCLITPYINENEGTLTLNFPYHDSIKFPLNIEEFSSQINATMCETKVCGDRIRGYDCGNEVADWISNVLMIDDLRLIKQSAENERKNGDISLANQAQFLLINEFSVVWLMSHVENWDYEGNVENIVDRFRGNLIIENAEALIENQWKSVVMGECEFSVQGPCTRCQMICIDQSSGEKTTEPLRTIGRLFKGKTRFGIYLKQNNFKENLKLKCGDEILPKIEED